MVVLFSLHWHLWQHKWKWGEANVMSVPRYLRAIGNVANSKRPLLIIPKVQLRLRVTRRSATALTRYPQKLAKIVCGVKLSWKFWWLRRRSCVHTVNNRGRLEIATSAIVTNWKWYPAVEILGCTHSWHEQDFAYWCGYKGNSLCVIRLKFTILSQWA